MSRTKDLEKQDQEHRRARTVKLQHWATELEALARQLEDADRENGWHVRYGYVDSVPDPPLTALVTIGGAEFVRFVRDELGIIGVFEDQRVTDGVIRRMIGTWLKAGGRPERFADRYAAFDAAVKRRIARQKFK
jgi:hypothetical protein